MTNYVVWAAKPLSHFQSTFTHIAKVSNMLRYITPLALTLVLAGAFLYTPTTAEESTKSGENGKLLRHVVMFQFKSTSSEADVQKVVDAFRELPSKIPTIADFEYGTNNSPENLADGLTHCFLVSFKSEEDRAAYLPHAAHMAFVDVLKPHLEKVVVIDYWAGK